MTNKLVTIYGVVIMSLLSIAGLSIAEERYQTYEMGESGRLIFFKMSAEEIALEDAALARSELIRNSKKKKTEKWVETIEFAESGMVLEFPMSKKQIGLAKAKAEQALLKAKTKIESPGEDPCLLAETVEMGDGNTVVFYTPIVVNSLTTPPSLNNYVTYTC